MAYVILPYRHRHVFLKALSPRQTSLDNNPDCLLRGYPVPRHTNAVPIRVSDGEMDTYLIERCSYTVTSMETYTEPVIVNTFTWCLQIPPRCPKTRTEMRQRYRVKASRIKFQLLELLSIAYVLVDNYTGFSPVISVLNCFLITLSQPSAHPFLSLSLLELVLL